MHWLDIVIVVALLLPMYIGYKRGLIGTLLPLVAIVLGILVAGRFYDDLAGWFHPDLLGSEAQAEIVAFAIILVLFMVAMAIVSRLLQGFLALLLMGWADKIGGLAFGVVTGGVISAAVLTLIANSFPDVEATFQESTLAAFLLDQFPFILYLLPDEFDAVRDFFT